MSVGMGPTPFQEALAAQQVVCDCKVLAAQCSWKLSAITVGRQQFWDPQAHVDNTSQGSCPQEAVSQLQQPGKLDASGLRRV